MAQTLINIFPPSPSPPSSPLSSPTPPSPSLLPLPLLPFLPAPTYCPGSPYFLRPYLQLFGSLLLCTAQTPPGPLPRPRISSCVHLLCRMPLLSLSWLGLGHTAASPWLLLLLVGASCLLAYILPQVYAVFENSRRLRCFPQPPTRNWLSGHLGLVSVAVRWAWGVRVERIGRGLEQGPGSWTQGRAGA